MHVRILDNLVLLIKRNVCVLEISKKSYKKYAVSLYGSLGQTTDEFDSFINNLEKLITHI